MDGKCQVEQAIWRWNTTANKQPPPNPRQAYFPQPSADGCRPCRPVSSISTAKCLFALVSLTLRHTSDAAAGGDQSHLDSFLCLSLGGRKPTPFDCRRAPGPFTCRLLLGSCMSVSNPFGPPLLPPLSLSRISLHNHNNFINRPEFEAELISTPSSSRPVKNRHNKC